MAAANSDTDAYELIIGEIDAGIYGPGVRLVESDLADRFGMSRTPVREALQRLETESFLRRDGRSLVVAKLDHGQLGELYIVRAELEGLAAFQAAQHAASEEISVLYDMIESDQAHLKDPDTLSRTNRRFHRQLHLASHNRYLVKQLERVHRTMALLTSTSLAADGRGPRALQEHREIVEAIEAKDGEQARQAVKRHLSHAFEERLKLDAMQDLPE